VKIPASVSVKFGHTHTSLGHSDTRTDLQAIPTHAHISRPFRHTHTSPGHSDTCTHLQAIRTRAHISRPFGHTHISSGHLSQDKVRWRSAALTAILLVPVAGHVVHCHPHVTLFSYSGSWATVERYGL